MTKTKKKIIAGATLGVVAGVGFVGANASADEVTATTDNTATNLVTTQPVATPENTVIAGQAGTETGTITTPVESTGLNQAVAEAEQAGVQVDETPVATVDSIEEADKVLANQEAKVDEAKNTQEEVDATKVESEKKATEAGVEIKIEPTKVYKDDNKSALEDAKTQSGQLAEATDVQNTVNKDLPTVVKEAKNVGVVVSTTEGAKYEDAQKALADLANQVATIKVAKETQVNVDSAIALAVSEAQKAGVKVNLGAPTTIKDVQTAIANAQAQVKALADAEQAQSSANKIIADAKANATASGTVVVTTGTVTVSADQADAKAKEIANNVTVVVDENNAITAENARKQAEYKAEIKRIQDENAKIDAQNEAIRAENARKQAEHDTAKAEAEAQNAEILARNEQIKTSNAQKLAEYQAKLEEAKANTSKDGYLSEAIAQNLVFKDEPNAIVSSIDGAYKFISSEKVIETGYSVWTWDPQYWLNDNNNFTSTLDEKPKTNTDKGVFDNASYWIIAKKDQPVTITYDNLINSSYKGEKISRVVYTLTPTKTQGNSEYVVYQVMKDPTLGFKYGSLSGQRLSDILRGGELNSPTELSTANSLSVEYFFKNGEAVDFSDGTAILVSGSRNGGIDENGVPQGEYLKVVSDNIRPVTITGSSIGVYKENILTATISQSTDKGAIYAPSEWDTDDSEVRWYGAGAVEINSGTNIDVEFGTLSYGGIQEWFTFNTEAIYKNDTPTPPTLEREQPATPVNVTPPTLEDEIPPLTDNPTPPTPKELKKASIQDIQVSADVTPLTIETDTHTITMVVPVHDVTVATTVNPVQVVQTPANSKSVNNTEGADINKQLVAKASTVKWVLSNEALKGGRDYTVSYVMTDPLPVGFELNLLATAEATPDYNIKYDAKTNMVTFTAKDALINALNADLSKSITVPVATIIGTVLNDGATYQNTFTTTVTTAETVIVDKDGKVTPNGKTETYKVVSNTPEVYTPGSDYRTYNGNVVVRYFTEEDGKAVKIAPNQTDLEDAKIGTKYDTTDQKAETIAFEGKTYKLTEKVVGNETGNVTRGTIFVDYYYEIVPEVDGEGNVIIHYQDEEGNKIANDVVDTPNSPIGTDYTTTDNKPNVITTEDGIKYELVPTKTIGNETGKVSQGTTEVTYVYKRLTPKPSTPTPNDNVIEPSKHIYTKDGQQIDGMTLLPNTEVHYTGVFDLDQFKGMVATAEDIAKGIAFFDDLQDNTVSIDVKGITNTLADGTAVTELIATEYNSVEEAPEFLKSIIEKSGIKLDGKFIAWVPENPTEFYNKYIVTGQNIYHNMPITVGDYVGTFQNKVWQVVFGNGYEGNVVENNIPKLEVLKDAVKSVGSNESIADGTVELGQTFPYVLDGPAIQANIVGGLQSYVFTDDFDEDHDEYNGEFYAFADQDIKLKDGTVIKAGDEITRYFVQNIIRNEVGVAESVTLSVDPTFLASIAEDGIFDPKVYLLATRIAYAENVENTVKVSVNGYEVTSNTVVTHTPEPKEPETPETPKDPEKLVTTTPVKPTTPVAPASVLPSTGDNVGNLASVLGMALLSILGLFGLKKRKED
ncbi:hypothetical protein BOVMAS05_11500 [Streptococcus uberis]